MTEGGLAFPVADLFSDSLCQAAEPGCGWLFLKNGSAGFAYSPGYPARRQDSPPLGLPHSVGSRQPVLSYGGRLVRVTPPVQLQLLKLVLI